MSLDRDTLYRVSIQPDTNTVQVSCIGINRVDSKLNSTYLTVEDLPQWVQERIALLMMTEPEWHKQYVDGVGQRVEKYTFWVCGKEGWEINFCVALYNNHKDDYQWSLDDCGYPTG